MPSKPRQKPSPTNLTQQARLVLDYMMARDDRKLTPLAAHMFLGIASLTARVAELRAAFADTGGPDPISSDWEQDNFKRRFKVYFLTKEQREAIKAKITGRAQ